MDAWLQVDNTGTPNSFKLREFLADEDVLAILRDKSVVTATGVLKQSVCGANDGRKPSQGIALAFAADNTCGLVPARLSFAADNTCRGCSSSSFGAAASAVVEEEGRQTSCHARVEAAATPRRGIFPNFRFSQGTVQVRGESATFACNRLCTCPYPYVCGGRSHFTSPHHRSSRDTL